MHVCVLVGAVSHPFVAVHFALYISVHFKSAIFVCACAHVHDYLPTNKGCVRE